MLLHILYLIGITAEAMTGALAAGRRRMDTFGVIIIATATALGGGSVRDILLGHYPLGWVKHPEYVIIVAVAAVLTTIAAPVMPMAVAVGVVGLLLLAVGVIFVLRLAYVELFSSPSFSTDRLYHMADLLASNSAALIILLCVNIIYVRHTRRRTRHGLIAEIAAFLLFVHGGAIWA